MKKWPLLLSVLLLGCYSTALAQDSTRFRITPHWETGDHFAYQLHKSTRLQQMNTVVEDSVLARRAFHVLAQDEEGYTIRWEFTDGLSSLLYGAEELLPTSGIPQQTLDAALYRTALSGELAEVLNHQQLHKELTTQVVKALGRMVEQGLLTEEEIMDRKEEIAALYRDSAIVETLTIKELGVMHNPYAMLLSTADTLKLDFRYPNLFADGMLNGEAFIVVSNYDPEAGRCSVSYKGRVNKEGIRDMLRSFLHSLDLADERLDQLIASGTVEVSTEVTSTYDLHKGIPLVVDFKTTFLISSVLLPYVALTETCHLEKVAD